MSQIWTSISSSDGCAYMERPIVCFHFDLYSSGRNKIQNRVSYKP